jgi:flagellar biosynthesis/type III secretory pathway chaperone
MPENPHMNLDMMLEQLIDLIGRETQLYKSVPALIDKEKEAVVRSQLKALNEAVAEKENIINALRQVDGQRRRLVTGVAEALGYPPRALTLKNLSQLVDEPFAGRLRQAGMNLTSVLNQVQEANQRSKQLFEHSLGLLRGAFNLLNELLSSNPVYYRTGSMHSSYATGKCVSSDI